MIFFPNTPWIIKQIYSGLTWNKSRSEKKIYLTFDDGPVPEATPFVLEELKKFDAKATFFVIGDNVRKNPELFNQIKQAGHSIGNHTFNHLNGWKNSQRFYLENIEKCNELIHAPLFRPPYGRTTFNQLREIKKQYQVIMWDVLSGDYNAALSREKCLFNVIKNGKNGSIVLFHDSVKSYKNMSYALPKALDFWKNEGYEIVGF